MNGRKARALRRQAGSRREYQALKWEAHRNQGQRPKFDAERKRRPAPRVPPSWPGTKDQRKQSRPMIVIRPIKHLDPPRRDIRGVRRMCGTLPKWAVDWAVLAGWNSL